MSLACFINAIENDIMTCKPTPIRNNLSRKARKALTTLRKRTDIVIKPISLREKICLGGGELNIICPNETCWSQMHKMIIS